jgi:hypothetical protein
MSSLSEGAITGDAVAARRHHSTACRPVCKLPGPSEVVVDSASMDGIVLRLGRGCYRICAQRNDGMACAHRRAQHCELGLACLQQDRNGRATERRSWLTCRCSGSGRRRGIGVESQRRLGGAQTAERQGVSQTGQG